MNDDTDRSGHPEIYGMQRLLSPAGLLAGAVIGAVLVVVIIAFAYTGGFLSPQRLTQARVVDQFERTNGLHAGFRRNHSKGVCFNGWFDSNGAGEKLSKAVVFRAGRTPVFGRFALAGGQPLIPDTPAAVHSMAVNFALTDGETWRTGMNGIPVFPVGSARDLTDQLAAAAPDPTTGKPDPKRLAAFMADHPQAAKATAIIKAEPLASDFANTTYNSLDAFLFVDSAGKTTPVRWSMAPEDSFAPAKPDPIQQQDRNYQFDALTARVAKSPLHWHLLVTIGHPDDPTADATLPWPTDRERIDTGVLTIDRLEDEAHGACRDVTFDPLILPAGIEGSDDPILSARSATYAVSFTRRGDEPRNPAAVQLPSDVESPRP